MEFDTDNIQQLAKEKIEIGSKLCADLANLIKVDGVQKVKRRIEQEIKFLRKVTTTGQLKSCHILCSNIKYYETLTEVLKKCKKVQHVDYPLKVENRTTPLRVDIVCDDGLTWIKVVARNARSLADAASDRGEFGCKNIVEQAREYIDASQKNVIFYKTPKVFMHFSNKLDDNVIELLTATGVHVSEIIFEPPSNVDDDDLYSLEMVKDVDTLNLDITTLLAYVSNLSNGSTNWEFLESILTDQARAEEKHPVKPILDELFKGRKLICCKTAVDSFNEIISLLGGEMETLRSKEILQRISVLPDINDVTNELTKLKFTCKIKPRSLKIFSFGMYHKAVTVSSNDGFVRSARMEGLNLPVFIHAARALTEKKEKSGKRLNKDVS